MMDIQKLEQRQVALLSQLQSLKCKVQDLATHHGVKIDNVRSSHRYSVDVVS